MLLCPRFNMLQHPSLSFGISLPQKLLSTYWGGEWLFVPVWRQKKWYPLWIRNNPAVLCPHDSMLDSCAFWCLLLVISFWVLRPLNYGSNTDFVLIQSFHSARKLIFHLSGLVTINLVWKWGWIVAKNSLPQISPFSFLYWSLLPLA